MNRWLWTALCLFTWTSNGFAQQAAQDSLGWDHSIVGGIALSQVAFKDWAQGGESALAWTLSLDGQSRQTRERVNLANSYNFALGQSKQGEREFRKTDDKIDLESVLIYKAGAYVNPFLAVSLKTQFAPGFQYDDNDNRTQVSRFFDPAYLIQSVGAGIQPITQIRNRFGFALRETFTRDFNSFADDPETPVVEKTNVEGGFESVTRIDWNMTDDIIFKGKFELFVPLENMGDPIIRNDSTLVLKVNRFITTNVTFQLINDQKASSKTQIKQALSIGVSYALL